MAKLIETVRPLPATGIGASAMKVGLYKANEYIDGIVTDEYNFQRESLYAPQIPPQLITGSLVAAALVGFIFTHAKEYGDPNSQNLIIFTSILLISLVTMLMAATFLVRRRHTKIDDFAIEKELLNIYQYEVAFLEQRLNKPEDEDLLILTKIQSIKIPLLRDQIILCREENRYRHHIVILMRLAMQIALLTGGIVAGAISVYPHSQTDINSSAAPQTSPLP